MLLHPDILEQQTRYAAEAAEHYVAEYQPGRADRLGQVLERGIMVTRREVEQLPGFIVMQDEEVPGPVANRACSRPFQERFRAGDEE
ncbi:hypothetical protein D3C71_937300 [compost metagenome]